MENRTYSVITLGCRVNRSDSIQMERELSRMAFTRTNPGAQPDLWVVNTCAVTVEGMRKSRKAVRKCVKAGGKVIVTGCAVAMDRGAFESMGVHAVISNSEKGELARAAAAEAETEPVAFRTRDLVRLPIKVQDGCRRYCTYCIVPYLRGRPVSRGVASVLEDVRFYREAGAGEVILCGIDLGSYRDPDTGEGLESLARGVVEAAGDMWVRVSSLDISDVSDRLLSLMRNGGGLCRHLHLPMQSGDGRVLSDMRRDYSPEEFRRRVEGIREAVPGVSVTTDVMVGFPTEDQRAFENTRSLLDEMAFSRVHVFRYSPRPGTAAHSLGDTVPSETKRRRAAELRRLAGANALRFHRSFIGRIIAVLIESEMESEPGYVFGRAQCFAGVIVRGGSDLVSRKVRVRVRSAGPRWLRGDIQTG